ncbi:sigma 54-interacting transcriptional regulator [Clostridium sp. D2Q-14]|uniref:sigma-54-dependent Fis family transcriptional regulator n=1 Tax=Anaeromonas gelatinilytica TaxID=2683194 RepID=UPI00193B87CF|nr:sigma 54-interacting transcriptional regulator [Anaeromonas gelatinilytica]MBS4534075.1 sigma 54-interacting transcriptional regulator [Anaeromonas gelatinilytica]
MEKKEELNEIYDTLVRVSNAIVSVINIDITIVDKNLNRIAGTGKYLDSIGEKLDRNCLFSYSLRKGESFIVENPKYHKACINCENRKKCKEQAQVCCPIIVDGNVEGVIGLIAFNAEQKSIIEKNKRNLLEFLNRMADLISSKIKENRKNEETILMAEELEILLNSMDTGVISTDDKYKIKRYNSIAKEMFNIGENNYIDRIIKDIHIADMKKKKCQIHNKEFEYTNNDRKYRAFYNVKPIIIEGEVTGCIFTFNKMKEMLKVVNDLSNTNMTTTFDDIIGDSLELDRVKDYARRISKGNSTVLVQGESGTGKELFARAIHNSSDRRNKPFIALNCTAIPENLIESELFGYAEGAFTGAKKGGKLGKFELAHKGTIFLDEIGDMPLHLQTKLLRVLQENVIERVGGNNIIPVDVRVITATNKILEDKVKDREFREDLYYRLNVIPINLPSLRNRVDDVNILAYNFLKKFNYKLDRNIKYIDESVIDLFKRYNWPGNIRELENVVEYAVNMCSSDTIKLNNLPRKFKESTVYKNKTIDNIIPLRELERIEIKKALIKFGRDKNGIEQASKNLGISRSTIYRKIKEYDI